MLRLAAIAALALALVSGFASSASARTLTWSGTFELIIGDFARDALNALGTGVSTVGSTGVGGAHLNTLRVDGGLTITGTLPLTDPENATLVTLMVDNVFQGRPGFELGQGTLAPISGGGVLTLNTLTNTAAVAPVRFKQCLIMMGCANYLPIPLSKNGTAGAGIGNVITINTFSAGGGLKISIVAVPWTLGLVSIKNIPNRITLTPNGGVTQTYALVADGGFCKGSGGAIDGHGGAQAGKLLPHELSTIFTVNGLGPTAAQCVRATINETRTEQGFVHGAGSGTSSTAQISGVIQIVTPTEVSTSLTPPNQQIATFIMLKLHFIPEPGMALLLGSGVAGLVLLGRSRMRG